MHKLLRSQPLVAAGLGLVVAVSILAMRGLGWLEPLELQLYDRLLSLRPARDEGASRFVVVGLTEQDIMGTIRWPVRDDVLTQVLEGILAAEPRGIGVDLFRDVLVPPGSEELEALLQSEPGIVMVQLSEDEDTPAIPPPRVLVGTQQTGLADVKLDRDDTIRRALLYLDDETGVHLSLALQVALRWLEPEGATLSTDPEDPSRIRLGETSIPRLSGDAGGYAGADDAGYQILIDFEGTSPGRSVSFGEVLRGEFDAELLRDRLVFVGYVAESVSDLRRVPFGLWPGVYVHAHIASQLVRYGLGEARPIAVLGDFADALGIVVLGLLGAALGLQRLPVSLLAASLLAGAAVLFGAGYAALQAGWWISVAPAALAWVIAAGAVETQLARAERRERESLMRLFSRHVSRQVAEELWRQRDQLLENGRIPPRTAVVTVMFCDVKSFTPIAEALEALETTHWVNELMDMLAEVTERHGGFVDDYFGDGMKADFGVPLLRKTESEHAEDARAAARCAIAIEQGLARLNQSWRERGKPECRLRVGIHTGTAVAASIGHNERLKYTVIGENVNAAARIESIDDSAHDYRAKPVRILVSDATLKWLGDSFESRPLGEFALRGMRKRVAVHEILGQKVSACDAENPARASC